MFRKQTAPKKKSLTFFGAFKKRKNAINTSPVLSLLGNNRHVVNIGIQYIIYQEGLGIVAVVVIFVCAGIIGNNP